MIDECPANAASTRTPTPLLASVVAGWDRRRLLTLSLLWYAVFLGLSALMPSFGSLLIVRVLTVVSPAIFTPQAAACVGLLVPAEQRGRIEIKLARDGCEQIGVPRHIRTARS